MIFLSDAPGRFFPELYPLYRAALPFERVSRERFLKNVFFDPNFAPEDLLCAEEDGVLSGFLYAPVRRIPVVAGENAADDAAGYLAVLAVRDPSDVPSAGNLLLEAAEARFSRLGKKRVTTGYFPLYLTQGVESDRCPAYARLYEDRGYRGADSVALRLDLSAFSPDTERTEALRKKLREQGYETGPLREEFISSLLDPASPFSSASWSWEFRSRAADGDFSRFFVCAKDGRVLGACVFGDPNSDACRFGPFGVSPECRGLGIGRLLLSDCLCEMRRRALPEAWLQWGASSGPACHLYSEAGFRVEKRYRTYAKTL